MVVSLLSVVLVIGSFQITGAFQCYSCTYLFAGHDGSAGYDCVNNTAEFSNTIQLPCELPKKCVVKSVYERGYARLLSMQKSCQLPTMPDKCESPEVVRPVCYRQCATDLCNDIDGNFMEPISQPSSGGAFQCYSCTYLFAGHDGSAGYDCVNNTAEFSNTIQLPCELPKKCVVKSVYERGYARLLSMEKSCQLPTMQNECQSPELVRPVCYRQCATDLCNGVDGNFMEPISQPSSGGAFQCYSCTYLFAGHDGSAGYDCVNNTAEFPNTGKLSCELPNKCIVKSVYERGYARLLSMEKSCQLPTMPDKCESPEVVRPVCSRQCATNLCNDIDGNFMEPISQPSSGGAFQCYSCTYLFSGHDGSAGYDCVNNTAEFPNADKLSCELPKKCIVISVYERGYAKLLAMEKSCQLPTMPDKCDSPEVVRPVCYRQCTTDLCNGIDGNFMEPISQPSSGGDHTSSYVSLTVGISMLLKSNML